MRPHRNARAVVVAGAVLLAACGPARAPAPSPRLSDTDYMRALHMMVPVAGARPEKLQDSFTGRRGDDGEREHRAIDILAPKGTPVLAAVDGEILRVSSNTLGGKTIYATDLNHRLVFYYAHLDRYAERARVGARVRQGMVIGYVGTTGNAPKNVPHLHFQVMRMTNVRDWWDGPPIDPFGYFARAGSPQ